MTERTKKIIYWTLSIVIAFTFVATGLLKLVGGEKSAEMAQAVGGYSKLVILGSMEIIIAILLFVKRMGVVAILLAVAYMGGAMAVHFVNKQPILLPLIIQILIWITAALRFPELTQRLFATKQVN